DLPQARNGRLSMDSEAIVVAEDDTMYIGDEYGPYIYRFDANGRLLGVIKPPPAFIPRRAGREDFSAERPEPDSGRSNNRGFEGLALHGTRLLAMLQSPTIQDGGGLGKFTRAITYDIADARHPRLIAEHVVELPTFKDRDSGKIVVAPQSEVTALSDVLFLMLCRDNNHGYGAKFSTPSHYRWIGLVDLSKASNIAAKIYDDGKPVVENGKLVDDIIPATFEPFIDINDEHELRRFGLRNGNPNGNCDRNCLSEKWES